METTAAIDATDPMVVLLAWGLTYICGKASPKTRKVLPIVAVLVAVAVRSAMAAVEGEPLSMDVLMRALGAAGVAVLGHSQMREVAKARR